MLDQIRRLAETLSLRQKIYTAAAAVAVTASLFWLVQWNQERDFAVLYSGLAQEDAAAVVAKLKESAAVYRISSDGATIRVNSARVPELRLQMASAGLPKTGRIGFELFDRNNFGITEFAEQVNYHRALEGELERTILGIAEVEHSRVHITPQKDSVFLDHRRPAKASVLLRLRAGKELSRKSALAIAQMVSNAVDGLAPEAVTLLDVHGNLLNQARKDGGEDELNTARIAYRRNIENDLLAKVNSTLEPLLGPDRFRAAVSAEVDYSTADQSEEAFDPAKSVMANSQRTEDTANSAQPTGVPGAPSNLPRPTSRPGLAGAVGVLRRSETINYQTSRMVKRTHIPHGTLRRVSVGVLLDHHVKWEDQGGKGRWTAAPPSAEQLKAAREVVAGAVGLEPDRGDQLVVESLPFERTVSLVSGGPGGPPPEPPGAGGWLGEGLRKKDPVVLGILAALVLTVMAGGWMFWKKKAKRVAVEVTAAPAVVGASSVSAAEDGAGEISAEHRAAEIEGGAESGALAGRFDIQHTAGMVDRQRREEEQEREILESLTTNLKLPSAASKKSEVLAKHLGDEARRNPDGLAQIVRSWINDGE